MMLTNGLGRLLESLAVYFGISRFSAIRGVSLTKENAGPEAGSNDYSTAFFTATRLFCGISMRAEFVRPGRANP